MAQSTVFTAMTTLLIVLASGCNPSIDNKRDIHGYAEIHKATRDGNVELVEHLLLEQGAKVNNPDSDGLTPLHHAVKNGDLAMAKLLLQRHADPKMTTKKGWDAVHLAVWRDNMMMFELVMSYRGITTRITPDGWSTVHMAACKGSPSLMEALFREWATTAEFGKPDLNKADNSGATPLMLALRNENYGVCSVLIRKGASVEVMDKGGNTPLHLLAGTGNVELAERMVLAGGMPNQVNQAGKTAFDVAMEKGDQVLAQYYWDGTKLP